MADSTRDSLPITACSVELITVWECTHNGPPALLRHRGHAFNHSIKRLNMATIALPGISAGHSLFALGP